MADICPTCGLPVEVCVCEDIAREQQIVSISAEKRRYGKVVTIVAGLEKGKIDIEELARKLKTKCASGGTVKDGNIELQGDHKKKVEDVLKELGFNVEVIE
ncbi:MAG: stress response translation initiation inhibitor YciH [Candidatus Thermoplasmatota archaeon]